jgi:hypothetical protein
MQLAEIIDAVQMNSKDVRWLAVLATGGLVIMWSVFWLAIRQGKESTIEVLGNPAFFKTVSVMGIIAATAVLSLAGRLDGNLTGAILSGIVGYVLGASSRDAKDPAKEDKPKKDEE